MFVRTGAFLFVVPFFGRQRDTFFLRLVLSVALGSMMWWNGGQSVELPRSLIEMSFLVMTESFLGLALGFALSMLTSILVSAGEIISSEMGFAMARAIDPDSGGAQPYGSAPSKPIKTMPPNPWAVQLKPAAPMVRSSTNGELVDVGRTVAAAAMVARGVETAPPLTEEESATASRAAAQALEPERDRIVLTQRHDDAAPLERARRSTYDGGGLQVCHAMRPLILSNIVRRASSPSVSAGV
jgi:hypothetical protein